MIAKEITIFISSLRGGGAERVSVTIANKLIEKGIKVHFLVLNLTDVVYHSFLNKDIKLIDFNVKHARTSFIAVFNYLRKADTDNILVFNHEIAIVVLITCFLLRKRTKIIARNINTLGEKKIYERSIWHKYIKDIFIKLFYGKVDHIIVQSEKMKTDLIMNYKILEKKIQIINNPIAPCFEEEAERSGSNVFKKKHEILFIGRLEHQKGLKYLLDAFNEVIKIETELKLRLIGKGVLYEELLEYSKSLNINNNVIFEGHKEDIIPYYKQAKLTVLSSLYEGFPNVLVESITLGTPVVAFDCNSGPSEIIQDSVNGFLVKYKDVKHLAESIIKALEYDWDVEQVKRTAQKYKSDIITKKYIQSIIK